MYISYFSTIGLWAANEVYTLPKPADPVLTATIQVQEQQESDKESWKQTIYTEEG